MKPSPIVSTATPAKTVHTVPAFTSGNSRNTPTSCSTQPAMYVLRRPILSLSQPANQVATSQVTADPATAHSTGPRSSAIGPSGLVA